MPLSFPSARRWFRPLTWKATVSLSVALLLGACNTTPQTTDTPQKTTGSPSAGTRPTSLAAQAVTAAEPLASTVARNADGSLELFVRSTDNQIYHRWQQGSGGAWTDWASLGGSMQADPVAIAGQDGKLTLFAVGTDQAIWIMKQDFTTQTGWTPWAKLGGRAASAPQAARNTEGNLEVFYRGSDNALWHAWEQPDGRWSAVASLGHTLSSAPSIVLNNAGRLQVFVKGSDNALWFIRQDFS